MVLSPFIKTQHYEQNIETVINHHGHNINAINNLFIYRAESHKSPPEGTKPPKKCKLYTHISMYCFIHKQTHIQLQLLN